LENTGNEKGIFLNDFIYWEKMGGRGMGGLREVVL
jgi:hypothetical protein